MKPTLNCIRYHTSYWYLPLANCSVEPYGLESAVGVVSTVYDPASLTVTYECDINDTALEGDLIRHCTISGWNGTAPRCPGTCKPSGYSDYELYVRQPDQSVERVSAVPVGIRFSIICSEGTKPSRDVTLDPVFYCSWRGIPFSIFTCTTETLPYPRFLMSTYDRSGRVLREFESITGEHMQEYHESQAGQFSVGEVFSWFTMIYISSMTGNASFIEWNPSASDTG